MLVRRPRAARLHHGLGFPNYSDSLRLRPMGHGGLGDLALASACLCLFVGFAGPSTWPALARRARLAAWRIGGVGAGGTSLSIVLSLSLEREREVRSDISNELKYGFAAIFFPATKLLVKFTWPSASSGPWFLLVIASSFSALKGYSEVVRCNLPDNNRETVGVVPNMCGFKSTMRNPHL
eukprot:scaffold16059_cov74-Skeletonema_menzelii.AAC.1